MTKMMMMRMMMMMMMMMMIFCRQVEDHNPPHMGQIFAYPYCS